MKTILRIFICSVLGISPLFANFDLNANCCAAYSSLIRLRFAESSVFLQAEKALHPNNQMVPYLENSIEFLKVFISEDENLFEQFKIHRDQRLDRIEEEDSSSPYYLYTQSEILFQSAVVKVKFKEYISAAYEIHKAFRMLEKNAKMFPNFVENYKSLGFLHTILGSIPEEYKWIANSTGFTGNMSAGLDELRKVMHQSNACNHTFLREESMILLAFIELNLNKDEKALEDLLKLDILDRPEKSPIACFVTANFAIKTGKSEKAIQILQKKPQTEDFYPLYYLDYMQGLAKLNRLDPDAIVYLLKFINRFKGKNYIKAAYQKLGWYYLVHNDVAKYTYYMQACKKEGSLFVDEDKQAMREAESGEIPNLVLLKARLLTDGGFYDRAIAEIAKKPATYYVSLKDKLELTYRLGRIYHLMKNYEKSIYYYEATLKNGATLPYYFAANSALNLGYLYEETGHKEKAIANYEHCLRLKNHDYQNSIDQKAKFNLNKLKKL